MKGDKVNVKAASGQTLILPLCQKKRQNSELPSSCCVCKLLGRLGVLNRLVRVCVLWNLTEPTG